MKSRTLIFFIILLCFPLTVKAQTYPNMHEYQKSPSGTLSALATNPWNLTSNSAGMVFNNVFLSDSVSHKSYVSLKGTFRNDTQSNYNGSKMQAAGNLQAFSVLRINKLYLKGQFEFNYDWDKDATYNGFVSKDFKTPFMLTDSIPGNISREFYNMGASFAYPWGEHFSLGAELYYKVGIMAKHRDLRNRNTSMDFRISPSLMFSAAWFRAGVSGGYLRNTEKIEYTQIDGSSEKYLFELQGLWIGNSYGYSNANTSRLRSSNTGFAALQIGIQTAPFKLWNELRADFSTDSQEETGYNGQRFGDVKGRTLYENLRIDIMDDHSLFFWGSWSDLKGYRFLQRQELDPQSSVRVWKTYGDPIYCYQGYIADWGAKYAYRFRDPRSRVNGYVWASYSSSSINQTVDISPARYNLSNTRCTVNLGIRIAFGRKFKHQIVLDQYYTAPLKKAEPAYDLNESIFLSAPANKEITYLNRTSWPLNVLYGLTIPLPKGSLRMDVSAGTNAAAFKTVNTYLKLSYAW